MSRDNLFAAGAASATRPGPEQHRSRAGATALSFALLVMGALALGGCEPDPDEPPPVEDAGTDAGSGGDAGSDGGTPCGFCVEPEVCGGRGNPTSCAIPAASRECSEDGWCWEYPLPHGYTLNNAHFLATQDGWAVGESGRIQHWDGTRWTRVASGTTSELLGVHAVSATETWAVGRDGTVLRSSGGAFSAVDAGTRQHLQSVWASGSSDLWAVGAAGTVVRNRGSGFQAVDAGTTQRFNDVWGSSPEDVWLVGEGGTVRHHDGNALASISTNTTLPLYEVTGTGPNDVWAVTSEDPCLFCDDYGIVYRVSTTGLEERLRISDQFFHVFAAAPQTMLVAGEGPRYRWDGSSWLRLSSGQNGTMAGASPNDVWLFGRHGHLERWNGSAWSTTAPNRRVSTVLDIHGSSANDVWAVDNEGRVLHWNGGGWTSSEPIQLLRANVQGVYAASPSEVWMVTSQSGDEIVRWNGTGFADEPTLDPQGLMAIHGSSATDIWAVGLAGEALHRDATGWTRIATGVTATLNDVWVQGPSLAVAVGSAGTIMLWSGSAWSPMTSGTDKDLLSVWGTGASDLWAVGAEGTLLHFNGTAWSAVASGTQVRLNAVWGVSATEVWAVGDNGTLLKRSGAQWVSERTGMARPLNALWAPAASDVWLGGVSAVLRKN
ncbi:WD40/YVTN/BNR-like repeat-containing protein [Pyxidicoccus trucidator]|uniref:WD40/YVTN/BNR-like repeat-containing protein n=1 Tax=Pyxidicoccus trucidator TaxID=2709662 RepID=UPI0013DCC066|nr:hypothetical protein [Pyxidicoccus trucidator]